MVNVEWLRSHCWTAKMLLKMRLFSLGLQIFVVGKALSIWVKSTMYLRVGCKRTGVSPHPGKTSHVPISVLRRIIGLEVSVFTVGVARSKIGVSCCTGPPFFFSFSFFFHLLFFLKKKCCFS